MIPPGWRIERSGGAGIEITAPNGYTTIVVSQGKSVTATNILYMLARDMLPMNDPVNPRLVPRSCGYCTYEESDGELIEQCVNCKGKFDEV